MKSYVFASAVILCVFYAPVGRAQFVDNGGQSGNADTTTFGQSGSFENITTSFNGIEFRLLRLIKEPNEKNRFRMVAELENTVEDERELLYLRPYPSLVDELGNTFELESFTGIGACSGTGDPFGPSYWRDKASGCDDQRERATRAALNVPIITSIRFGPNEKAGFSKELADLATYATLKLHFLVGSSEFGELTEHEIVVPRIPLPK